MTHIAIESRVAMKLGLNVSLSATLLCVSALALAGCSSLSGRGGPSVSGGSVPAANQGVLTELGNGLLGSSANQLSQADRRKALEAEYRALEYSPAGKAVSWRGSSSGNSGDVVAAQAYQVGSQNCRQYTHTFTIDDSSQTARGTACRNTDGSWTPLN